MEWRVLLFAAVYTLCTPCGADLPAGCTPLNEQSYGTVDPSGFYPADDELQTLIPPQRMGSWRPDYSIPTQHFVINQIKPDGPAALRLMPYSAWLSPEGVTYDAYTMDRWSEPERSDEMQQQTPSSVSEPYVKVTSVGTNMKQIVSGPDGNPKATFTGKSGVQVGIEGSADPVWTGFGELWGTFLYSNTQAGSMEVPLVRGSALLTHRFQNANPILMPYCLSTVNGVAMSGYSCPVEQDISDPGEGFLSGTCTGDTLHMTLHATKAVDLTDVQWAAAPSSQWPAGMNTCGPECTLSPDALTVDILIPGASGTMSFAINVIGKYVLPNAWQTDPMTTTCTGRFMHQDPENGPITSDHDLRHARAGPTLCENGGAFCHTPTCDIVDAVNNFQVQVTMDTPIPDLDQIQFAVSGSSSWGFPSPMLTCDVTTCTMSPDNTQVTYYATLDEDAVKYAVNVIGRYVMPPGDWVNAPYDYVCGTEGGSTTTPPGTGIGSGTKFILELDEPDNQLPDQTRKFVAYFSEEMTATSGASGLVFTPTAGGVFTGIMQLVYTGATPRSDMTGTDYFDQYAGLYSYEPVSSFCLQDGKTYVDFNWNKHDFTGPTTSGDLLMVTMPHHESILTGAVLQNSPFTFKAAVGDFWLLELDAPPASMDPDQAKVDAVKANPTWNQNMLTNIPLDAAAQNMDQACDGGSYWGGKAISKVARLASISRAFGTNDYVQLDQQLVRCLDRWIRINDTLSDGNKFLYDTVYGGLLLRSVPSDQPIDLGGNYGFPAYSDHHFHLGYWVYAMGYYAKYYPSWGQDNNDRIVALARDIGNPGLTDKYFPVVRHKDFYLGHSWATGIIGGQRQQESSSEAIAAYHGLATLGQALGNTVMEQTGQVMLATEIHSVRAYYHVRADNEYYFPSYIQEYGTIGMFGEDNIFLYTLNWPCAPQEFPMRHACLVGIQILPIISVSYLYMDQEWSSSVYDVCSWSIDPSLAPGSELIDPAILQPVTTGWGAYCQSIMSQRDASAQTAALAYTDSLATNQFDSGATKSSTLLFMYVAT